MTRATSPYASQRHGSTSGYAEEATTLIDTYERLSFEQVHRVALHLYPPPPARVLDIGAGTGRDAAALASRGYDVTAVEPTHELRTAGQRLHTAQPIRWCDDALPTLASLRTSGEQFDLILLTAVWMHLDAGERSIAMAVLAGLAAPSARIAMSLRHGSVPAGRCMFDVTGEETVALAATHGLGREFEASCDDSQGRRDVHWTVLVLRAPLR